MKNKLCAIIGFSWALTSSQLYTQTIILEAKVIYADGQPITPDMAATQLPNGTIRGKPFGLDSSHQNCVIVSTTDPTMNKEQLLTAADQIYVSITGEDIFQ